MTRQNSCNLAARPARLLRLAIADWLWQNGLPTNWRFLCQRRPWHTHRDRLATARHGLRRSTPVRSAKMARDVSLLMQDEVGEVSERGGGSSTMPHKRNPSSCAVTLAAAVEDALARRLRS